MQDLRQEVSNKIRACFEFYDFYKVAKDDTARNEIKKEILTRIKASVNNRCREVKITEKDENITIEFITLQGESRTLLYKIELERNKGKISLDNVYFTLDDGENNGENWDVSDSFDFNRRDLNLTSWDFTYHDWKCTKSYEEAAAKLIEKNEYSNGLLSEISMVLTPASRQLGAGESKSDRSASGTQTTQPDSKIKNGLASGLAEQGGLYQAEKSVPPMSPDLSQDSNRAQGFRS